MLNEYPRSQRMIDHVSSHITTDDNLLGKWYTRTDKLYEMYLMEKTNDKISRIRGYGNFTHHTGAGMLSSG